MDPKMETVESSSSSCVPPPGFRFHPTEEELVGYYLNRKINSLPIDLDVIIHIDLYSIEPWDIQDSCKLGYEQQKEWYFFSHKDRKYPTGTRTNRATAAGFWKATGRDKAVLSKDDKLIGMRKTLVYYKGRAPNGRRSDWIMHEYRLHTSEHESPQEEGWVVCRAFKKPISPSLKQQAGSNYMINNSYNYYGIGSRVLVSDNYYNDNSSPLIIPTFPCATTHDHNLNQQQQAPRLHVYQNQMVDLPNLLDSQSGFATNIFEDQDLHNDDQCWKSSFDKQMILESQVIGAAGSYISINVNDDTPLNSHCFPDL